MLVLIFLQNSFTGRALRAGECTAPNAPAPPDGAGAGAAGRAADLLAGLLMMQFMMFVFYAHSASGTPLGCCTPSRTLSLNGTLLLLDV